MVLRCLQCNRGIFRRMLPGPGRYKAIPPDQWEALDGFWQMRRAEILADLQVFLEYDSNAPPDQTIAESQVNFPGQTQRRASLIHELGVAGYPATAESMSDLIDNRPVEFARVALKAREKNVVHDGYAELLVT